MDESRNGMGVYFLRILATLLVVLAYLDYRMEIIEQTGQTHVIASPI